MLVRVSDLVKAAKTGGYAVGAFSFSNPDMLRAIIDAAWEQASPVVLLISPQTINAIGFDLSFDMAMAAIRGTSMPVGLQLDHAEDETLVYTCIKKGFTDVLFDGSNLDFDENLEIAARVASVCRAMDVSFEGEIGPEVFDDVSLTTPDMAARYLERVKPDAVAPTLGTQHGVFKGSRGIQFSLLSEIAQKTDVPITLHGTSGLEDEEIREAVSCGVSKINVNYDIRRAYIDGARYYVEKYPGGDDPRKMGTLAGEYVKSVVKHKMELFGSVDSVR